MRAVRGLPILALSVALAACDGTAAATPTPSLDHSPEPTVAVTVPVETGAPVTAAPPTEPPPTTGPTPGGPTQAPTTGDATWAIDPPTPILVGSVVRVTVDELNLRDAPFTSATQTALLARGTTLYVEPVPPVDSDGYIWYRASVVSDTGEVPALPASIPAIDSNAAAGWLAAGTRDEKYVSRIAARCPGVVNLRNLAAMTDHERLACFGGDWVEIEGLFQCTGCLAHAFGTYAPEWLAHPALINFLEMPTRPAEGINLRFPPDVAKPEYGAKVRVRVHLRDAAAETCTMTWNYWWEEGSDIYYPAPDVVSQLLCRQEFVVKSFEAID